MLRLEVSPRDTTVMAEDTVNYVARGVWSDGSTTEPSVTWTATAGVFLSKGVLRTPKGKGKHKVIATVDGAAMSDTATVTVQEPAAPALVRLTLAPSSASMQPGGTQQFAASGTWADSSTGPVPVTYSATGGTISAAGLYTAGTTAGTFRVIAVADSSPLADTSVVTISVAAPPPPALVSIALTPASVALQSGQTQAFAVTGSYSDGTTGPAAVTYTATGGTISSTGVYTAGTVTGNFRVIARATGGTAADTSAVTIAPTLVGCTVSPASVTLNPGQTQQFTVAGNLSNGTTTAVQVTWTATGGTITASGLYTAGNVTGKFTVAAAVAATAISCSGSPEIAGLAPPPAPVLTAVEVTPPTATLAPGATQAFSAVGRMSDNSTTSVSVTWSATGGTVSSTGSYTAGSTAGTFRVIAVQQGGSLADTAAVTITSTSPPPAPTLSSLSLTPSSVSVAPGGTQLFVASALWSDGSTTLPALTWSATGGTITGGLYTAGSATGTFRAIVSGGGKADTSAITIASAGPNAMYFNSAEPGCGTDPNVLMCDDFEDGDWYVKDCDQANASGGLLQTDGWCGTIFANPITPAGAVACGSAGVAGTNCAASHGAMAGQADGRNMADHAFVNGIGVDEVYVRFYTKASAGYLFGAEKVLTFNDGLPGGAGIKWGNLHFNCGAGSASSSGTLEFQPTSPETQCFTATSMGSGRWYYVEAHLKLSAPGQANGVVEIWVDDCGTSGVCAGSPTLRMQRTTVRFNRLSTSELIRVIWFENWANPGSTGTRLIDQVKVSRVGPIGFMP